MRHLGRYRLDEQLGSGAFATVWKGFDPELDSPVAIKVLADNWSSNADVRERFLAEARLLRRIAHPEVVRVHDVGTAPDEHGLERPYFVMDLVTGGTLADRIGTLAPLDALELAIDAARAVQVLHDEGALHRDLKPSNLLVDESGTGRRVLVADLGSAKLLADASVITMVAGSPAYMAPEQASQDPGLDGRADVYALGVVAYQLLSGRLPYDAATPAQARARADVAPAPIAPALGLPPAIDQVLAHALSMDPASRFASCATFADAIRDVLDGGQGAVPSPVSGARWRTAVVAVAAVVTFVLALLLTVLLTGWLA